MLCMMFSSVMYDVQFMLVFLILQVRRVQSTEQESDSSVFVVWGWFEEYGMMISVKVGFLYMAILKVVGVLRMVTSRQFKAWFSPISAVNCKLRCSALKSLRMIWMQVLLESKIRKKSSTYLQQFIMPCLRTMCAKCRCSKCCRKIQAIRTPPEYN